MPRKKKLENMTQEERVQAANEGVKKALGDYKVDFDLFVILRAGMVVPQLRIVPLEMLQDIVQQPQQQAAPQGAPMPSVQSTAAQ